MSSQLRLTAQAKADAWQQSADAEAEHDQVRAENARSLATVLAVHTRHLEAADARFEEWSARTASTRETAEKAKAELQRRGQQSTTWTGSGSQSMSTWCRELQARADTMDRAIEREHQAAVSDGQPWPRRRKPDAGHQEPDAAVPGREPQLEQPRPGVLGSRTEPGPEASKPGTPQPEATEPVLADDERTARLDELQARADQAARRIDAQRAELDASSQHTARAERESQAGPAAGQQAETPYDMEMEL
jgi:hypothetical protein